MYSVLVKTNGKKKMEKIIYIYIIKFMEDGDRH